MLHIGESAGLRDSIDMLDACTYEKDTMRNLEMTASLVWGISQCNHEEVLVW